VNVSQQDSRIAPAEADVHAIRDHPVTAMTTPYTGVPRLTASLRIPRDPAATDQRWPDQWPLRSALELAALETAPGCARAHARAVLWEWKADKTTADDVLAALSELVTNAVTSTRAHCVRAPVRLWLLGDGASVLILVWDATVPVPTPGPAPAAPEAEHGRGLAIVEGLCARWGWYFPAGQPGGKVVWALTPPPGPPTAAGP
jgi:anti-sigma regulatory factor (Ser/Thr protein kinase)